MYVFLVIFVMLLSFGARRILAPESISSLHIPFFTPVVVETMPEDRSGCCRAIEGVEEALGE